MTERRLPYVVYAAGLLAMLAVPFVHCQPGPPPGYWGSAAYAVPCSTTQPYKASINPSSGETIYLRYDVGFTLLQPTAADGQGAGQGGAMHTVQVFLDGYMIPLRSGFEYPCPASPGHPPGFLCDAPPAPFRDAGGVCEHYDELNGPEARPCPSGLTVEEYGVRVKQTKEWLGAWPANNRIRQQQCSGAPPVPTTSRTSTARPGTPSRTPSRTRTPVPGPCPPGAPCPKSPTRPGGSPTSSAVTTTPTRTPRPATFSATPILTATAAVPSATPNRVVPVDPTRPAPRTVTRPTASPSASPLPIEKKGGGCAPLAVVATILGGAALIGRGGR